MKKVLLAIVAIVSLTLFVASPALSWHGGIFFDPRSDSSSDPFRPQSECNSAFSNGSACWWVLNWQVGIGGDYVNAVPGTRFYDYDTGQFRTETEEETWRRIGQEAIEWTEENYPEKVDIMRRHVNTTLAQYFGSPDPEPEPEPEPDPDPEPEPEPEPEPDCDCSELIDQLYDVLQTWEATH